MASMSTKDRRRLHADRIAVSRQRRKLQEELTSLDDDRLRRRLSKAAKADPPRAALEHAVLTLEAPTPNLGG